MLAARVELMMRRTHIPIGNKRPIDIVLKVDSKETTVVRRTTRPHRLHQCGSGHDRSQLRLLWDGTTRSATGTFLFFSVCRSPFVIFFSIYESVMRAQESITSPLEDEGRIPGPEDNSKSRHGGHSHTGRGSDGGDSDDNDAGDNNSSGGGGGGYRGVGNHSASSGSGAHSDKEGGDDSHVVSPGVRPEPSCAHQGHGVYRLVFALDLRPAFCSHALPSRFFLYGGPVWI